MSIEGKDFLTEREAAQYACVSYDHFRRCAPRYRLAPFLFMGKRVYRKIDLKAAMEAAREGKEP